MPYRGEDGRIVFYSIEEYQAAIAERDLLADALAVDLGEWVEKSWLGTAYYVYPRDDTESTSELLGQEWFEINPRTDFLPLAMAIALWERDGEPL